jgi:hypothetical protein
VDRDFWNPTIGIIDSVANMPPTAPDIGVGSMDSGSCGGFDGGSCGGD